MEIVLALWAIYYAYASQRKVKTLNLKFKKLERKNKGENTMSQLITKLINQNVQVSFYSELESYVWTVLEVDEDWVKLTKSTKKGKVTTRLVRVDDIRTIELV